MLEKIFEPTRYEVNYVGNGRHYVTRNFMIYTYDLKLLG
jgi:hypothetical protein